MRSQPVGDAAASIEYLSRYVFKVAISESRIVRADDVAVVFRYRKVNSSRLRTMALSPFATPRQICHRLSPYIFPTAATASAPGFLNNGLRRPHGSCQSLRVVSILKVRQPQALLA